MMEELWIETDQGKVFAKAMGDPTNPLVLGLHGWSQRNGWHTWEPMMAPLAQAGMWVVSVDMPGWGRSAAVQASSLAGNEAVQVVRQLLDGLGASKVTLMGKSWGGGIALAMALNYPSQVYKLLLTAPAFRQIDELTKLEQPVLLAWARDDPVIPYSYAQQFLDTVPDIQLASYESGGHSAAPKNAKDFAEKSIRFLQS